MTAQVRGKVAGGAGIAASQQVPARVAGHPAQARAVGGGRVGGQQVRHQLRPPRPGDRVNRVAGVGGGQDRLGAGAGGGGLLAGEPVPQDGLGEPVQHQAALVDPGQRLPGQAGQGLPPGQRIGRPGGQLARQFARGAGEQVLGDRLGGQERAHAGQLGGGRILVLEPAGGQPGRRGQRPRIRRPRRGLVQQLPGLGPQQVQVLGGAHAGLGHEPGRLRNRQRQVPELGGEPARVGRAQPGHPVPQQRHRFGPGQHVDLDRRGELGPGPRPGGDQHVPVPAGQPRADVGGGLGVVEDQQPPAALPQFPQHRRPHSLGACPGLDAAQRGAQGGELVADQPALLGVHPPRHVIVRREPVRVLDRQLGLAHPAQALQRLHHRPVPGQQPVPDRRQQLITAGESRVAGRDVPHPQHAARRQRTRTLAYGGQLPQRPFHQPAQLVRAGKRLRDQAAGLHPAAERLLPGPERVINQLPDRDPHIGGGGVQQEHQPRQPGRGGGIELQLGVGHLRLIQYRRPVPGAQHPHIHLTAAHPLRAQLRGRLVSGGKAGHLHDNVPGSSDCPLRLGDVRLPPVGEVAQLGGMRNEHPPPGTRTRTARASHPPQAPRRYTRHQAKPDQRRQPSAAQSAPGDDKA